MRFEPAGLAGAYIVHLDEMSDDRGFFARTACTEEFAAAGLVGRFAQSSISFNHEAGTLRGMHFSVGPHAETKLVRCTSGAVLDVLVDVRPGSATRGRTVSCRLDAGTRRSLYVPHGVAHGFQTLADGSEVLYMIDEPFRAEAARGFRWNDPVVAVDWPLPVAAMSERDANYPNFRPDAAV